MGGAVHLRQFNNSCAPIEGEVDAERNQGAEDSAEYAAFAYVKPIGFDFDNVSSCIKELILHST